MNKKVYFAGSIRGGQDDTALYHQIISFIQQTDIVLTEQVGDVKHSAIQQSLSKDQEIYTQDTSWIKESDLIIAECTHPSLGVGYELAYGEKLNKPIYIYYRPHCTSLSAMLTGNPYFHIDTYESLDEIKEKIKLVLENGEL